MSLFLLLFGGAGLYGVMFTLGMGAFSDAYYEMQGYPEKTATVAEMRSTDQPQLVKHVNKKRTWLELHGNGPIAKPKEN